MSKNNIESKNLHNILINEFRERNSSSHLISNLMRSRNIFFKMLFITCFLISTTYCVYTIARITENYYKYDTVTSLKVRQEIPTNFPAVSFCNLKPFNKLSSTNYLKPILSKINNHGIHDNNYGDDLFEYFNDEAEIIESNIANINGSEDFRRSLGYELKNMLITYSKNEERWVIAVF